MTAFGNMSLNAAVFEAPVTFQDGEFLGGLWCEDTRFLARADFRGAEVHGRTWMKGASLGRGGAGAEITRDIRSFGLRWL